MTTIALFAWPAAATALTVSSLALGLAYVDDYLSSLASARRSTLTRCRR